MERSSPRGTIQGWIYQVLVLWVIGAIAWASWSHAGILLANPPHTQAPQSEEEFPDSQFGHPPIRTDSSIVMEDQPGSRKPAGLEFTDETGQVKAAPVIEELGTPSTLVNTNPKPNTASRTGVQEVALIVGDLGFFPKTLFVTRDIPVRLFVTGASKKSLCVMMDFFKVRRQIRSHRIEEINFTPPAAGQYRFYCPINGMEGTILVKEVNSLMSKGELH